MTARCLISGMGMNPLSQFRDHLRLDRLEMEFVVTSFEGEQAFLAWEAFKGIPAGRQRDDAILSATEHERREADATGSFPGFPHGRLQRGIATERDPIVDQRISPVSLGDERIMAQPGGIQPDGHAQARHTACQPPGQGGFPSWDRISNGQER
jgi:hypothetical protein